MTDPDLTHQAVAPLRNLSWLLVMCLVSIGLVAFKIYPVLFLLFVAAYFYAGNGLERRWTLPVFSFLFCVTWFGLLHISQSFDFVSVIKLYLNMMFFLCAATWMTRLDTHEKIQILYLSAAVFLVLSSAQAFLNVWKGGLWMLPFNISLSSDSYLIEHSTIFFGDANKNIWASKHVAFLIILIACRYCGYGKSAFPWIFMLSLMPVVYVSSRTAQLGLLVFLAALFFYHFVIVRRRIVFAVAALPLALGVMMYVIPAIFRFDFQSLGHDGYGVGMHGGDGFRARLIIWNYIFETMSPLGYLFGNGILSFANYTNGIFSENNPHNVFLSVLLDFGLLSLLSYLWILVAVFLRAGLPLLIGLPFMVFILSQYIGYDTDLIVLFLAAIGLHGFAEKGNNAQ